MNHELPEGIDEEVFSDLVESSTIAFEKRILSFENPMQILVKIAPILPNPTRKKIWESKDLRKKLRFEEGLIRLHPDDIVILFENLWGPELFLEPLLCNRPELFEDADFAKRLAAVTGKMLDKVGFDDTFREGGSYDSIDSLESKFNLIISKVFEIQNEESSRAFLRIFFDEFLVSKPRLESDSFHRILSEDFGRHLLADSILILNEGYFRSEDHEVPAFVDILRLIHKNELLMKHQRIRNAIGEVTHLLVDFISEVDTRWCSNTDIWLDILLVVQHFDEIITNERFQSLFDDFLDLLAFALTFGYRISNEGYLAWYAYAKSHEIPLLMKEQRIQDAIAVLLVLDSKNDFMKRERAELLSPRKGEPIDVLENIRNDETLTEHPLVQLALSVHPEVEFPLRASSSDIENRLKSILDKTRDPIQSIESVFTFSEYVDFGSLEESIESCTQKFVLQICDSNNEGSHLWDLFERMPKIDRFLNDEAILEGFKGKESAMMQQGGPYWEIDSSFKDWMNGSYPIGKIHFGFVRYDYEKDKRVEDYIWISENAKEIHLSDKGIIGFSDLGCLSHLKNVEKLYLDGNPIHRFDLRYISDWLNLREIWLNETEISELNLAYIAHIPIARLAVDRTRIDELDFTYMDHPLKIESLEGFDSGSRMPSVIKVSFLFRYLKGYRWWKVASKEVQFTSLIEMRKSTLLKTIGLLKSQIKDVQEKDYVDMNRAILEEFGYPEFVGLECHPSKLFGLEWEMKNYSETLEELKEFMYHQATQLLKEQIENKGSTKLLDIEKLGESAGAAKLIPGLLELKSQEVLESLKTSSGLNILTIAWAPDSRIHIKKFRETTYGAQILNSLDISKDLVTPEEIEKIKKVLIESGFDLEI
ncbi:MAG: hypothetical protein JW779_12115 [Candidatus Thorarchaeota archaeon]|nr:hypothetical protein [Candidatus Thorarchaeota archaeon]